MLFEQNVFLKNSEFVLKQYIHDFEDRSNLIVAILHDLAKLKLVHKHPSRFLQNVPTPTNHQPTLIWEVRIIK